jgi:hypothetical protein
MTENFPVVIGSLGATIILVAFILNQLNKIKNDSLAYDLMNLIGSILLIWYAILLSSIPFLILNGVWAIISLKDIVSRKR